MSGSQQGEFAEFTTRGLSPAHSLEGSSSSARAFAQQERAVPLLGRSTTTGGGGEDGGRARSASAGGSWWREAGDGARPVMAGRGAGTAAREMTVMVDRVDRTRSR